MLPELCALHVGNEGVQPFVVETQSVDQGLRIGQAKHAGLRVPRLCFGGDGTDFDKAKTHGAQTVDTPCIFVQSGGQADPVREGQACQGDGIADEVLLIGPIQPCVLSFGNSP